MYERFTDQARKVMQLAHNEAQRLNHVDVRAEHILLGLIKHGRGVAADVLRNLDIDLRKIRLEVEKLVPRGPDVVTMRQQPQTPQVKKVIDYSMEEARTLNHNYVGTEHILLALFREQDGGAGELLMNLGLELDDVRNEILGLTSHADEVSMAAGFRSGHPQMEVVLRERKEWELRNHPVIRIYIRAREACYKMLSSPDLKQRRWAHLHLDEIATQLDRLYADPPKTSNLEAFSAPNRRPLEWRDANPVVRVALINTLATHLQEARGVLLVGQRGSGRRTAATMVAQNMLPQSAQLVVPNHLGIAATERPYRESVRALSRDLVESEGEIIALPELHDYVGVSWGQNEFANIWKVFLSTLFENHIRFLAWTTPHGLTILRDAWPGLIDRFAIETLEDLSHELVHDVVCAQLALKCDELGVFLEDGFVGELMTRTALWKQHRNFAEPGRTVVFGYQVLYFDRANFSEKEESDERATLRATYLKLRQQMQEAIATNHTKAIDSLLPVLTAMRDKLGGKMAERTHPRRLVSKEQIGAFLSSD